MSLNNQMTLQFKSLSANEAFARITVAAFISQLNPTMDELTDIKTVISEAVTNSIIHGYENDEHGLITISVTMMDCEVTIVISDQGKGIDDIEEAMQPLFTSKPELERSGMGFTIMESFMDKCEVKSSPGTGTTVTLTKRFNNESQLFN